MEELIKKAAEVLQNGSAKMIIGYSKGSKGNMRRAIFIRNQADAGKLIYDNYCTQNLAVYLTKNEVRSAGKVGIIAREYVLHSIIQLAAESQISDDSVLVIGISNDGKILSFANLQEVETYVSSQPHEISTEDKSLLDKIDKMTLEEKWKFWQEELSRCIKCFACRASCPMCYCSKCAVYCNKPQVISVAPDTLGNFEWHITRAMHLAGRCVSCGECYRACPVGIPINLLTEKIFDDIYKNFGTKAGGSLKKEYALSMFKPDDKEEFIR
jgi:ferredoxin